MYVWINEWDRQMEWDGNDEWDRLMRLMGQMDGWMGWDEWMGFRWDGWMDGRMDGIGYNGIESYWIGLQGRTDGL